MKRMIQITIALLLLLSMCACSLTEEELRERAVDQLNKNSELPFGLTLPKEDLGDASAYWQGGGWGCESLFDDDIDMLLSGYPDCQDAYHITEIRLMTPNIPSSACGWETYLSVRENSSCLWVTNWSRMCGAQGRRRTI